MYFIFVLSFFVAHFALHKMVGDRRTFSTLRTEFFEDGTAVMRSCGDYHIERAAIAWYCGSH
jgi:hypothetical protein